MQKLFSVLLLFCALSARAAITLVAHGGAAVSGGTATTSALNCTGASLLVVVATDFSVASTSDTISDSTGLNTWNTNTGNYDLAAGTENMTIWYLASSPHVSASQTFSATGGSFTAISASCWAGTSSFDGKSGAGAAVVSGSQPGSITPAVANEVFITGVGYCCNTISGLSIGSSFSTMDAVAVVGGNNIGLATAYKIKTNSTAENPVWTDSQTDAGVITMATFKPAVASGHCAACDLSQVERWQPWPEGNRNEAGKQVSRSPRSTIGTQTGRRKPASILTTRNWVLSRKICRPHYRKRCPAPNHRKCQGTRMIATSTLPIGR